MSAIQEVIPIHQISEDNNIEVLKKLTAAFLEITDREGGRDTTIVQHLQQLEQETKDGFRQMDKRLSGMDQRLGGVEKEIKTLNTEVRGLKEGQDQLNREVHALKEGQDQLNNEVRALKEGQDQVIDLLKMIAHNTAQK